MESRFENLEIERRFVFAGMTFTKVAPSLASDDDRLVHVFLPEIIVEAALENTRSADGVVVRKIPVFRIKWAK